MFFSVVFQRYNSPLEIINNVMTKILPTVVKTGSAEVPSLVLVEWAGTWMHDQGSACIGRIFLSLRSGNQ